MRHGGSSPNALPEIAFPEPKLPNAPNVFQLFELERIPTVFHIFATHLNYVN